MNKNNAYAIILDEQKKELRQRKYAYDNKLENLKITNKEYTDICNKMSAICSQTVTLSLSGNTKRVEELGVEFSKLKKVKEALLAAENIEPFKYNCNLCNDEGTVNGEYCSCVKNKAKKLIAREYSENIPLNDCSFENFNLNYYTDEVIGDVSPKKRMTSIFKFLKEYTINFNPNTSENILVCGGTGLGKTHLSLAILKELINREYNVLYFPSFNLFTKIENEHFNLHVNTTYDSILDCDLLIIDDLGSECLSPYGQSVFYHIINSRILSKKPTIINTNLTMRDIEIKYSPRVSSRIMGLYVTKKFIGKDIRQLKLMEK